MLLREGAFALGIEVRSQDEDLEPVAVGRAAKGAEVALEVQSLPSVERMLEHSPALRDVKETFFNSDPEYFQSQMREWMGKFGLGTEDVKNLTISAAIGQMLSAADDGKMKGLLHGLLGQAKRAGLADQPVSTLMGRGSAS